MTGININPQTMSDDDLLNRAQAAAYLKKLGCKTAENTLAIMAMGNNAGGGPPHLIYKNKRRRHVSYRRGDLDAWAAKKVRRVE